MYVSALVMFVFIKNENTKIKKLIFKKLLLKKLLLKNLLNIYLFIIIL